MSKIHRSFVLLFLLVSVLVCLKHQIVLCTGNEKLADNKQFCIMSVTVLVCQKHIFLTRSAVCTGNEELVVHRLFVLLSFFFSVLVLQEQRSVLCTGNVKSERAFFE